MAHLVRVEKIEVELLGREIGESKIIEVPVLRMGSMDTRGGRNLRPHLVRLPNGREVWVNVDEGDCRKIPWVQM